MVAPLWVASPAALFGSQWMRPQRATTHICRLVSPFAATSRPSHVKKLNVARVCVWGGGGAMRRWRDALGDFNNGDHVVCVPECKAGTSLLDLHKDTRDVFCQFPVSSKEGCVRVRRTCKAGCLG